MPKRYRFLKYVIPAVLVAAVLAAGWVTWLFIGTKPDYAGEAHIAGLSGTVNVYRDEHGVPHIFANNMNDAARALGYVHASERMFQMEMQRRAGQGRLSEVVGSATEGVDRYIRTLNLYALAESSVKALSPDAQGLLGAYAEGVNAWLDTHKNGLPPEFTLLDIKPEPWQPADSVVWGKLMALQLSHNKEIELLRAQLAPKLTAQQMETIFPPYGDAPVTLTPVAKNQKTENDCCGQKRPDFSSINGEKTGAAPSSTADALDQLGEITSLNHAASNEWAVAGTRTESGKPILANDPHLGLEAPILWYLARIVTPKISIKGATVPGLPVILLGQNDSIAWGMTTTGSDVEDYFIETLDPKDPHRYLTPDGSKPFIERTEVIHIRGLNNIVLHVRATRHGPVMSDIDPDLAALAGKGKVIAFAFTGLGAADTTSEALMRIDRAESWREFLNALRYYQSPTQNIMFADIKGDIGFVNPGLVPVRAKGDGLMPADGASGAYDWLGTIPFEQWPKLYNPPAGFIFNANNQVAPPDITRYLGVDWEEPYRAERLQQLLDSPTLQTLDTTAAMQADHVSLAARELLPYLLRQKPTDAKAAKALDMLRDWDGTMDKSRSEPLIFEAWLYEMHRLLLTEGVGSPLKARGPFAATSIDYALSHDGGGFCPDKTCDAVILRALDEALALLRKRDGSNMKHWRWGREHVATLNNKVFSHVPILSAMSDLSVASSGDFYTLDRGGNFDPAPAHPFLRKHGGGYRAIYDLADPAKSRFMIATGESGDIFSPHYSDLVEMWNDVKSFTLTGTQEELAARHLPDLVLEPVNAP